ncbi:hypothetical protein B0H14DRAFT_2585392 [Mycena olivaceomarginata]|nr:hypothetical protein B0H14DRAFT_2585392 [Mycena olivaceomarginata]
MLCVSSGKGVRAADKAAGKHRRKGPKNPPLSLLRLPPLSEEIESLRRTVVPETSPLYQKALHGIISPEFSDLGQWTTEPSVLHIDTGPTDPPTSPMQYYLHTRSLRFVFDGIRMREERERDAERRLEFESKGSEVALEALRTEVRGLLDDFERVSAVHYHRYVYAREYAMWEHYIAWLARTIHCLYYLEFLTT